MLVIIGSDNSLLPYQHQTITQTSADLSSIRLFSVKFNSNQNTKLLLQENYFEYVVCKYQPSVKNTSYGTGLILGLHLANERRLYKLTPSLIGWAQA